MYFLKKSKTKDFLPSKQIIKGLSLSIIFLLIISIAGCNGCNEPVKEVSTAEIKAGMAKESKEVTEILKTAESYFTQFDFKDAKEHYEKVLATAYYDEYKRFAKEKIAECEAKIAAMPPEVDEPEPEPPTLDWWATLDSTWQNAIRTTYWEGEPEQANIDKMFKNLVIIKVDQTDVTDLEAVAPLANLIALDFTATEVSDLSPVSGLKKLKSIRFVNTKVSDLSPLEALPDLQNLQCAFSPIKSLEPIAKQENLFTLDIRSTKIPNIDVLANLTRLHVLMISNNPQIKSIDALKRCVEIRELHAASTSIESLAPLSDKITLEILNINGTKVKSLAPIMELSLKQLYCMATGVSKEELVAYQKAHPDCKIVSDFKLDEAI